MTLFEITKKEYNNILNIDGYIYVDYRTFTPDGDDILTGICLINKNGDIVSLDYDSYSMNDEFINYEIIYDTDNNKVLVCYYESEWT